MSARKLVSSAIPGLVKSRASQLTQDGSGRAQGMSKTGAGCWAPSKHGGFLHLSTMSSAVFTRMPVNVSDGKGTHDPNGASRSCCRGPLAQIATNRPPGFNIVIACLICSMSATNSRFRSECRPSANAYPSSVSRPDRRR